MAQNGLDKFNTFQKFETLEQVREDLSELHNLDWQRLQDELVYEIFEPLEVGVIPAKIHFPEKD